jgi:uncharacterized protein (TIGR03000 family)
VPANSTAQVVVRLLTDARLYFEGVPMELTGPERNFVSPPLVPGRNYLYEVRAVWSDDQGHEVVQDRKVPVHAGGRVTVDFRTPPANPTPRTRQLPIPPVPDDKVRKNPEAPQQGNNTR